MRIQPVRSNGLGRHEGARVAQDGEEDELMGVVGGRAGDAGEIGGEEVGAGAVWAPGGEAGGDALLALSLADGLLELDGIGAVDENAGVGRHELVGDAGAAAGGHFFCGRACVMEEPENKGGLEALGCYGGARK